MSASLDYILSYQNYLNHEKRYSEHTVIAYIRDIYQFFDFLLEQGFQDETSVQGVTFRHVRQWVVHLMTQGLTSKSVNRKLSSIRTFYNFLKKKGVVSGNPTAKVVGPKQGKRLPQYLKENEAENLLQKIQFPEGWTGLRDLLILTLLYECGLRRSELIALQVDNIDFIKSVIKVMGKGAKERVIPIHRNTVHLIQLYMKGLEENDVVLDEILLVTDKGLQMYPKYVYNKVRSYLGQVTTLEKRSPHILRHTFATHLTDRGAEIKAVKDLLGHASLAATQVYTHNNIEKLKRAYKGAHPRS